MKTWRYLHSYLCLDLHNCILTLQVTCPWGLPFLQRNCVSRNMLYGEDIGLPFRLYFLVKSSVLNGSLRFSGSLRPSIILLLLLVYVGT